MTRRMIQVGTGGFGYMWCKQFLPPFVERGQIEVVAAVDVNPDALAHARQFLYLPDDRCYTDGRRAFEENEADFCTVVVPPGSHEDIVDLALARDMDILSEKPIASLLRSTLSYKDIWIYLTIFPDSDLFPASIR